MSAVIGARDGALSRVEKASLWVLDIDGVLLDPNPSFYRAAMETAVEAAARALDADVRALTLEDIAAFKGAGGWNDDFDLSVGLAWALIAEVTTGTSVKTVGAGASGGLPVLVDQWSSRLDVAKEACEPAFLRRRCAARYAGRDRCESMYGIDPAEHPNVSAEGLWRVESILCDADRLRAWSAPLAFFTGRNAAEAQLAAERLALEIAPERRVVDDGSCPKKPAPDGLFRLSRHADGLMLFVGDSIDDQNAALAYRRQADGGPEVLFARVTDAAEEALEAGADLVVTGLDALMDLVSKGDST